MSELQEKKEEPAQSISYSFSPDLPANCPITSAEESDCTVYVVVPANHLEASHFWTQAERGRAVNAQGQAACTRHGLSVFPNALSCAHQRRLFPGLGAYIACAQLKPPHGMIASSPSGSNPEHQTWWPYEHVIRHEVFAIVVES